MNPDREKWQYLKAAPARDAHHPELRRRARLLWQAANDDPHRFAHLAHAVARDWIRYQTDTARVGGEDIAGYTRPRRPNDPLEALQRGNDDCDAKARLFCALCLAQRVPAEMCDIWKGERLAHVYARVLLDGKWLPVELTLARARLGDDPRAVPKEADGKWLRT